MSYSTKALVLLCFLTASVRGQHVATSNFTYWAATVEIVDHYNQSYFDILYTPLNNSLLYLWDVRITPASGGLLDPDQSQISFDTSSNAAPLDTFFNSLKSASGLGQANHLFHFYNPSSSYPYPPFQSPPHVGSSPSELWWWIYDLGWPTPYPETTYHFGRVLYTPGGKGSMILRFFNSYADGSEWVIAVNYGVPEPNSFGLCSFGVIFLTSCCNRFNHHFWSYSS